MGIVPRTLRSARKGKNEALGTRRKWMIAIIIDGGKRNAVKTKRKQTINERTKVEW